MATHAKANVASNALRECLLEEKELLEFKSLLMITDKALSDWLIMNKNNSKIESIEISKKLKEFVTKRGLKN